jgi:peptidoglycan/xylan/chitin deacetylase (PgdA/CDA1 family)
MLNVRNITIVYFVALWFLYNTALIDPLFFWIAVPAWVILPVSASFFICANLYLKAICKGNKNVNHVSLSFNLTEPAEKWRHLNDILNKHKIPAIFFVTGSAVASEPDLVKKLFDSGHSIGNHSYSLSRRFGFYTARKLLTELHHTEELIYEATGNEVQFFRPPYGITNPAVRIATHVIQYQVIGWNKLITITNHPFKEITPAGIKNGSIIRVDFNGDNIQDSFEKFLIALKAKFTIVPLNELIKPGNEAKSPK